MFHQILSGVAFCKVNNEGCSSISRKGGMFRLTLNSLPLGNDGVKFVSGSFLPFSQDRAESGI